MSLLKAKMKSMENGSGAGADRFQKRGGELSLRPLHTLIPDQLLVRSREKSIKFIEIFSQ